MFSTLDTKYVLSIAFATSLVMANVLATKLAWFTVPFVGGVAVPAGFFAIAVAFLCTDLMSETYGKAVARKTVNGTVLAMGMAYILIQIAIWFQPAPFYGAQSAYANVLGGSSTVVLAAILTTLVSQHIDVTVFHYVRAYTDGHHKWARNLTSTGLSQLVDTTLFIVLAFLILPLIIGGSTVPVSAVGGMVLGQYAVKMVVAVADTPVFYLLTQ